jgi:hypothetical protein
MLMDAIHVDGWDKLECPMCNEDLYMRIYQRCDNPILLPCWVGLRAESAD